MLFRSLIPLLCLFSTSLSLAIRIHLLSLFLSIALNHSAFDVDVANLRKFASKYLFVRFLRDTKHLTASNWTHWLTWLGCTFGVTLSAYLIASGIPVFSDLVALIGALLGTLMCFQPYGFMWLYDNWSRGRQQPTTRWYLMVAWVIFVIVSGTFIMIAGTYGAVLGIIETNRRVSGSAAWSCADNSNSS